MSNISSHINFQKNFIKACASGNIEKIIELNKKKKFQKIISIIKDLFDKKIEFGIKLHNLSEYNSHFNEGFLSACRNGQFEVVKYLLSDKKENVNKEHINIGFNYANTKGHVEIIKYLLTSSDLKEKIDVNSSDCLGMSPFITVCHYGHLEAIKYLLTSPNLKEQIGIIAKDDYGFLYAYNNKHIEIIKYLIFDINIEKTNSIKECLKENPNEQVENMFKLRELNKNLNNELKNEKINNKKMKV